MKELFKKPTLLQDVEYGLDNNTHYLFNKSENKVVILENSIAIYIIKNCNGKNKIIDIIDNIEKEYTNTHRAEIEAHLIEMLGFLEKDNFIFFLK
jgi:hypothetical protein